MAHRTKRCRLWWFIGVIPLAFFLLISGWTPDGARRAIAIADSPSWGAPIAVSPLDGTVWVVNPDSGSVSVLDPAALAKITEIPVGREPWSLAFAPDGRFLYIVDRAAGMLVAVDARARRTQATIPVGPEPGLVAVRADGAEVYVSGSASDQLVVVDAGRLTVTARIAVAPRPFGLAVAGNRVYVTHLQSNVRPGFLEGSDDGREGQLSIFDAATHAATGGITLAPDQHGFPNLLSGIAIQGDRAWLPVVRAAPNLPNDFKTTVFAAVVTVDLVNAAEVPSEGIPLNEEDLFGAAVNDPVAAIPSPDGRRLYVVAAGSDLVEVLDVSRPEAPRLVKFLAAGRIRVAWR